MSERERILVVGGGIGGLALAIALDKVGLPVTVLEQSPALTEVGAGLGLWSSAVRALQTLGVGERLLARAIPVERGEVCSWRGRRLSTIDLGALTGGLGAGAYILHRGELLAALAAAVPAERVELGARVHALDDDGDGVTARLADGRALRGRLVVGADGLRSVVRATLFGDAPPRYGGDTCYRGVAPLAVDDLHTLREVQGPGQRCAVCVLAPDGVYWWAAIAAPEGERDDPPARRAYLLERYRGWPYRITDAIAATPADAILRHDLYDRPPLDGWSRGRVTLLGDAAHPTTPNLGQGACMAIEDAVVLARALVDERDHAAAFAAYERERRARTGRIVELSRRFGRVGQWRHPAAVWVRELMARVTPRRLVEAEVRRQIGYDAGSLPDPSATAPT